MAQKISSAFEKGELKPLLFSFLFAFFTQTCVMRSITAFFKPTLASVACFIIAFCAFFALQFIYKISKQNVNLKKQLIFGALFALIFALFLEGVVFNYKFYNYANAMGTPTTTTITTNINETDATRTEILLDNINSDVYNLHLQLGAIPQVNKVELITNSNDVLNVFQSSNDLYNHMSAQALEVTITVTDNANSTGLTLPVRTIVYGEQRSQYINLNLSPPVQSILIEITAPDYHSAVLESISLNTAVPMMFSLVRFFVCFIAIFLGFILRPRSIIYNYYCNFDLPIKSKYYKKQTFGLAFAALACSMLLVCITAYTPAWRSNPEPHYSQYQDLARSMANGSLSLGEAPEFLQQMENPYDFEARNQLASIYAPEVEKPGYRFDTAYYNGNYYVYFGIVPQVLTYLPYHLLTGKDLPNWLAVAAFIPLLVSGIFLLLYKVVKLYFKRVPYALLLVCSVMVSLSYGVMMLAKRPDIYALPIISGLAFTMWGLFFWLSAIKKPEKSARLLFCGSLCMALVAGCRPQLILFSAFSIVFFWQSVFNHRTFFSRKGLKATICAIIPYVAVAAVLMLYNYLRFDSPIEFGAQYNLTVSDITQRGTVFGRFGGGIFQYFFQTPVLSMVFPFVERTPSASLYMGAFLDDAPYGGAITSNMFLWFLFAIPFLKATLKARKLWVGIISGIALSVGVAIVDIQMGGILHRYASDFNVFLFILAAITIFILWEECAKHTKQLSNILCGGVLISCVFSLLYSFAMIYIRNPMSLFDLSPNVFATAMHTICFWL